MDDGFVLPPWGFSRDVLAFGMPDSIFYPTYRTTEGREVTTEVRVFRREDLTVLMVDFNPEQEPEDAAGLAFGVWSLAGRPDPFRWVWHSYERWGDGYWEAVWRRNGEGFALESEGQSVDDLLVRLATGRSPQRRGDQADLGL